jgi:hypothetical protein
MDTNSKKKTKHSNSLKVFFSFFLFGPLLLSKLLTFSFLVHGFKVLFHIVNNISTNFHSWS